MKISTEYTSDRQAIVTVEVDQDQMQTALKRAAQNISRVRPLPGFRPGKAPYEMVERVFGKDVLTDEAVEELSRSLYRQVLKESDINPVDVGSLDIVQKDPPIFKYTIPVVPEVKLGDYKSIHMQPNEVEVSDDEVNEVINRFQHMQATMVPVTRAVQKGDVITVDISGGVPNGEPVEEKNLRVTVGDEKQVHLPFDEQLIGMNAGETREIDFTYPEDYEDEAFRGKTAHYTVTVSDIKETQLPELTDEFAQAVSQFKTLDQFRGNIRDILRRQKEREEESRFANAVLQEVADRSEISYPPVMLEHELGHDLEHFKEDVKRLGLSWENYLRLSGKTEAQLKEELRPQAEKRLKQLLVLGELIKAENITVTREQVNQDIERRVQQAVEAGSNANTARRSYNQKDARDNIEFNLRVNQVMNKIVAMAKGEPTSGMILTPDMLRGETSPIPTGLITDPRAVREEDWPKGLEVNK
ncbi:MAG TPA: trigger factor [Anaerolineae bacterium]|nr:trigger factor [Anaerolineae bacterium]